MESGFEDKVAAFVGAHDLIDPGARVVAAVSGGADSVALLHSLYSLRLRGVLSLELVCAHVNHRLRGPDSDTDEWFVRSQAESLGIPFSCTSLDVTGFAQEHRLSIETAARDLRIEALLKMTLQGHGQAIATGHQRDDNAETVIHRLARGTGLRGLAGIWPSRTVGDGIRLIRPLLGVTRREVLQYLHERGLSWREDATNADLRFRRNAIRHTLLPSLQKDETPSSLVESLSSLALSTYSLYTRTVVPAVDRLWPTAVSCNTDESLSLDVEAVEGQPPYIQVEWVRQVLVRLGCGERDLTDLHYQRLLSLMATQTSGRAVSLPGGFTARRRGPLVRFGRPEPKKEWVPEGKVSLQIPGQARWGRCLIETVVLASDEGQGHPIMNNECRSVEWLDGDRLDPPLVIRPCRPGDRFRPLGQARDKKVSRFLIDARIPRKDREEVLVVEDQEKIVWVCPVRISDRVKVTESTRRVVRLSLRPVEG